MEPVSCVVLLLFVEAVLGDPKSQGPYQGAAQFTGAPQGVPVQFAPTNLQQPFLAAQQATPSVFEGQPGYYSPQQFLPQAAQPIQQVILPTNVDRQVTDGFKF